MHESVLKTLCDKLSKENIPAKLSEDGRTLSALISPPVTEFDIYGDVFFARFGGDPEGENEGLLVFQWEVADISDFPDDVKANLGITSAIVNSSLPAGGYFILVDENEDDEDAESAKAYLTYRMVLPVGLIKNEEWLVKEAFDAFGTCEGVLKITVGPLLSFAKGEISQDELYSALDG